MVSRENAITIQLHEGPFLFLGDQAPHSSARRVARAFAGRGLGTEPVPSHRRHSGRRRDWKALYVVSNRAGTRCAPLRTSLLSCEARFETLLGTPTELLLGTQVR